MCSFQVYSNCPFTKLFLLATSSLRPLEETLWTLLRFFAPAKIFILLAVYIMRDCGRSQILTQKVWFSDMALVDCQCGQEALFNSMHDWQKPPISLGLPCGLAPQAEEAQLLQTHPLEGHFIAHTETHEVCLCPVSYTHLTLPTKA